MKGYSLCLAAIGLCLAAGSGQAQSTNARDLAAGKFLVAGRELSDPNFHETVVLLIEYSKESAMGLVVNRRTRIPLSRLLEDVKEAKDRTDPVFAGGPVERSGILGLLRAHDRPDAARTVFGDVHLVTTRDLLEHTLAAGTAAKSFHLYLGYAGWGPGQLEREVMIGAWFIFRGDAASIFEKDPDTLWPRMIEQTELRIARRSLLEARPPWTE
jgi:putative transcriptional regulator